MTKSTIILCLLTLVGCGAEHGAYHLILVEKERQFLEIHTLEPCKQSGFDIIPKDYDQQKKSQIVELWITFENCNIKEKIILDDQGRVMWGVPIYQPPKPNGSVGVQ